MNKFDLKGKIIDALESLEQSAVSISSDSCDTEETAEIRSEVLYELQNAYEKIHQIMYNIY